MTSITILRDTGANQSLLLQGAIDLLPDTYLNATTTGKGVGANFVMAHLHRVFLESNIVNIPVVVGIVFFLASESC